MKRSNSSTLSPSAWKPSSSAPLRSISGITKTSHFGTCGAYAYNDSFDLRCLRSPDRFPKMCIGERLRYAVSILRFRYGVRLYDRCNWQPIGDDPREIFPSPEETRNSYKRSSYNG